MRKHLTIIQSPPHFTPGKRRLIYQAADLSRFSEPMALIYHKDFTLTVIILPGKLCPYLPAIKKRLQLTKSLPAIKMASPLLRSCRSPLYGTLKIKVTQPNKI